jgi:hypothetical protein
MRRQPQCHGAHLLRFDGKHDHLGSLYSAQVVRRGLNGEIAHLPVELTLIGIGNHQPHCGETPFSHTAYDRSGHVAAPNEGQLPDIVHQFVTVRSPL